MKIIANSYRTPAVSVSKASEVPSQKIAKLRGTFIETIEVFAD